MPLSPPQQFKHAFDMMNQYRSRHGAPPLSWDADLASLAQQWATHLAENKKFDHGMLVNKEGHAVGQNIAMSGSKVWDPSIAIRLWYSERGKYDFRKPGFSLATGHFTQIVWVNTTKVGMGLCSANGGTVVVADFSPPGNVSGAYVKNVFNSPK
jgi:uncharacterized protein YkwD